jgi:dTDP-4-amino-4,6-dideoxygalactose transaminase
VIVPSYTVVSTANAFVLRGAIPVFVDIREDTLNIDEACIEEKITSRTKAIIPVHYAGIGCEMDPILAIARRHHLRVVEDAAQGVNARYRGKFLGTLGDLGTFSFHATKNYTSGEGGALVVNNRSFIERAEILREKGTNRKKYLLGLVDKYTWVDIGSSFLLSDMLAAFLLAQLEEVERIRDMRKSRYETYLEGLRPLEEAGRLKLPIIPDHCDSNYHFFYILLPTEERRNHLLNALSARGVQAVFHYVPLHASPMGARFGYRDGDFPVTEKVSHSLARLPLYPSLTRAEQRKVMKLVSSSL